ncbi:MAG: phage tail protein [Synergistaceae bacterium]|nr:phage tail protein [Synergistaceae bacterium]
MIAALGKYEFEVSTDKVKTFTDLKFSNSAAYSEHKIIGRKGLIEFTGLNASTASLTINLYAWAGVNPSEEITELYTLMNDHELLAFTLGGEVMGEGLWVIESLDEEYRTIDSHGNVLEASINLKLRESVNDE